MKFHRYLYFPVFLGLLTSCSDVFEEKHNENIDEKYVWSVPGYAQGVLYNAYKAMSKVPDYYDGNFLDAATDNAVTNKYGSSLYKMVTGNISQVSDPLGNWSTCYNQFQYINKFLERGLGDDVLYDLVDTEKDAAYKKRLKGEAHFLRAYWGFELLQHYGGKSAEGGAALGYPLALSFVTEEEAADMSNFTRNTYQECVAQIIDDCNIAIENLPSKYTGEDDAVLGSKHIGRATSIAAMALKSKVALYGASPAYQDDDVVELKGMGDFLIKDSEKYRQNWERVAKISDEILKRAEFIKYTPITEKMLSDAPNTTPAEFIFRFYFNSKDMETRHFTPYYFGNAANVPTQNLVDAFPMSNGYPISEVEKSDYDATNPYVGRDKRFYSTVYYQGAKFGTDGETIDVTEGGRDATTYNRNASRTGYYLSKYLSKQEEMLKPLVSKNSVHYYPVLRKAEIFFNFAEASNEVWGPKVKGTYVNEEGATVTCKYSAYEIIKMVRELSGGITDTRYLDEMANDKDSFRKLIQNERRLEFAFENHRYYDMRRWLLPLNEPVNGVKVSKDDAGNLTYDLNVKVEDRKFDDIRYYYSPLPYSECVKNSNLINNLGWN